MNTPIVDSIRAEAGDGKFFFGTENGCSDVHDVHHVHTPETDKEVLNRSVSIVEGVISRGKDNPSLYGCEEFRSAWRFVCEHSPEERMRLRVEIKKEKPSGVPLGEIDSFGSNGMGGDDRSTPDELVALAMSEGELFYDEATRDGYVCVGNETMKVRSQRFADRLSYRYYQESGGLSASDAALKQACGTLSGLCQHQGTAERVFLRVGRHAGTSAYYLHGVGPSDCVVEVTATGWRMIDESPVKFWKSGSASLFPEPTSGSGLDKFWGLINIPEENRLLVLAWLLEALRPDTPFPLLELCGVQGSAKSNTQKRLRALVDPSSAALRSAPKTTEDAFVSAGNNWVVSLDNVSHLNPTLQDAFCIMATDGAYASRTLFTNTDETVLQIKRPVLLSGINNVVTAQDLISRTVHLELPPIDGQRRLESELDAEFIAAWPEIFGGLLDLFSATLAHLPKVTLPTDALRMADFNLLGEAMAQSMGLQAGKFTALYRSNYQESVQRAMESSPVAIAVMQMAEESPGGTVFEGSYKQLLERLTLNYKADNEGWPKSEKGLANALKKQIPALQEVGVVLIPETGPKQSSKGRRIVIRKSEHREHDAHGNVQKATERKKSPVLDGFVEPDGAPF